ncbi:hypothetical protein [Micromonospora chalcea]|uniref:hypothetical protein n=1 Tax=Micromonospora chalcea TaxID=1874 RepID=UPI00381FD9C2
MEIPEETVLELVASVLRCSVEPVEGEYRFSRPTLRPLAKASLAELVESLQALWEVDETTVVSDHSYELLIDPPRPLVLSRLWREGLTLEDSRLGLSYRVGPASDTYSIFMLAKLVERGGQRALRFMRGFHEAGRGRLAGRENSVEVMEAVGQGLRAYTVRIESNKPRPAEFWRSYADSLLFHLGYNLDTAVVPQRGLDELLRTSRISNARRSSIEEIDVPRRHYQSELVYHYQLGVSAESPLLEYLSYYHVMEYWFERIFQDDLVEQVQASITSPGFSYKRKDDVRKLIKKISKAVQLRDDRVVINEQVALRLTLERYIDLTDLAVDLSAFDPDTVPRYERDKVTFADGDTIPFGEGDSGAIFAAMSKRIYKTRNALVHSKDGARGRFLPFVHDKELSLEVPLVRFLAEQIIIRTSMTP